jgi:hypothetical protein
MQPAVVRAFRVVGASLMAVRLLLLTRHVQFAALQVAVPVDDSFFPPMLTAPLPLLVASLAPLFSGLVALPLPRRSFCRVHAATETLSAGVLLVHQATYYFATWVVAFWAGCFLVWLAWSAASNDKAAHRTGPFLAQLIISFLFLGGAAGKWTHGYWTGEPFYDMFFRDSPSFLFTALRARFDETTLHQIATLYSRAVVCVETGMAFVVFLPTRAAAILGILAALGVWVVSIDLFEVTLPIIGLACAAWILAPPTRSYEHEMEAE